MSKVNKLTGAAEIKLLRLAGKGVNEIADKAANCFLKEKGTDVKKGKAIKLGIGFLYHMKPDELKAFCEKMHAIGKQGDQWLKLLGKEIPKNKKSDTKVFNKVAIEIGHFVKEGDIKNAIKAWKDAHDKCEEAYPAYCDQLNLLNSKGKELKKVTKEFEDLNTKLTELRAKLPVPKYKGSTRVIPKELNDIEKEFENCRKKKTKIEGEFALVGNVFRILNEPYQLLQDKLFSAEKALDDISPAIREDQNFPFDT